MSSKQTIGRNDPCPCGSGKKYKKCCGAAPSKRDLYIPVLKTLGGAFFVWLLILRGVEGEPTEPIDPFVVGLIGFCGAVMGLCLGYAWAPQGVIAEEARGVSRDGDTSGNVMGLGAPGGFGSGSSGSCICGPAHAVLAAVARVVPMAMVGILHGEPRGLLHSALTTVQFDVRLP